MPQIVPLDLLTAGEHGRILEVDGRPEVVVRLEEMGLHAGAPVRMLQPGSPCILAINNHRLSFRGEESASILVEIGG